MGEAFAAEADLARPNPLEVNPLDKNAIVEWQEANHNKIWELNTTCANLIEEKNFAASITLL